MFDLWIDFNSVGPTGQAASLVQFAREGADLSIGRRITVGDSEGNICSADIVSVDSRGVVEVALLDGTMRTREFASSAKA